MLNQNRRSQLGRAVDIAAVAAVLGLAVFAYAEVSLKAGELAAAPAEPVFANLYQPGQNPWAGTVIEVQPPALRFASLGAKRFPGR